MMGFEIQTRNMYILYPLTQECLSEQVRFPEALPLGGGGGLFENGANTVEP